MDAALAAAGAITGPPAFPAITAEVDVVPRSCLRDRYRTMLADAIPL